MIMEYCVALASFQAVYILVKNGLELLDIISVNFEMHKSMAESCITVSQLKVKLSVFQSHFLDIQYFFNELLIREDLISIISLVLGVFF